MTPESALRFAEALRGQKRSTTSVPELYKFIKDTTAFFRDIPADRRSKILEAREWAETWVKMESDLDRMVAADPLLLYTPANKMSREFHQSLAFVRMICSANRTSKTASIMAEGAGFLTGRHWGRPKPRPPADIFQIGVDFQKYAPNVFEKKLVEGEPGCVFTPMFPENGKWFYHYDERKKRLTLACPECAEKGRAQRCSHTKSTWTLFSDNEGAKVLQGGAYGCGIYDEELQEVFWSEGSQRLQTVPGAFLLIGFTPLKGPDLWPHKKVAARAHGPKHLNLFDPKDPNSIPFASYHTSTQLEGGLVPPEKVAAARLMYDEAEAAARLDGEPVPIVEKPVFPRKLLAEMRKLCFPPSQRGDLRHLAKDETVEYQDKTEEFSTWEMKERFQLVQRADGNLRVWQPPIDGMLYILAVDCAIGLASGDPVCTTVLRVTPGLRGTNLAMVAQYHGWINSFDYAAEIFKIAIWYNSGLVAIENTGGYGEAVALKMREFGYWNLYVDMPDATKGNSADTEPRIGINTNVSSKPFMISAAQRFIIEHNIDIPCEDTIREMLAFEQARSQFGVTSRYRGASGTNDDRCMSICIGCGIAISYPLYKWEVLKSIQQSRQGKELSPEWKQILAERREQEEWLYE